MLAVAGRQRSSTTVRKYVLLCSGVALSAALGYRIYTSDSIGHFKRRLHRLREALQKYTDALAAGGAICSSLLQNLQNFLESEGDEVPQNLKQLAKLLQSPDVAATTTSTVAAVYRGIAGPASDEASTSAQQPPAIDKILDALLSDRGHSLVSVAISMGAKNLMTSYLETSHRIQLTDRPADQQRLEQQPDVTDKLLEFFSTQAGQHLAVMAVAAFASNGMRVYMDESLQVNLYEDLFSSMAKPAHLEVVKQCVGVFARDIVGAYLHGGSYQQQVNNSSGEANAALPPAPQLTALDVETITPMRRLDDNSTGPSSPSDQGHATTSSSSSPVDGSQRHHTVVEAGQPSSSTTGALMMNNRTKTRHDDLDSDGLLHESINGRGSARKRPIPPSTSTPSSLTKKPPPTAPSSLGAKKAATDENWISAVGKEWLNVVKDPDGREVMVSIMGSATRGVVQEVAGAATERLAAVWFILVLLLGAMSAWIIQMMLRSFADPAIVG